MPNVGNIRYLDISVNPFFVVYFIEIIREFIYPTEYDPPEIPQEFFGGGIQGGGGLGGLGGGLAGLGGGGGGAAGGFPVTPANPTSFEMRPVGVTLEVDPVVGPDGFTLELNIAPEVTEFEGFVNYGSPIQTGAVDALGQPTTVVLTENRIEQPVFSTRKLTTSVTIWDGQTVAIGGLIREDVQNVQDKVKNEIFNIQKCKVYQRCISYSVCLSVGKSDQCVNQYIHH